MSAALDFKPGIRFYEPALRDTDRRIFKNTYDIVEERGPYREVVIEKDKDFAMCVQGGAIVSAGISVIFPVLHKAYARSGELMLRAFEAAVGGIIVNAQNFERRTRFHAQQA